MTGTCGWLQVLCRAPQVTPWGSSGICRYLSIPADGCRYSARLCAAGLLGYSTGVCRALRGSTGIDRYLRVAAGTPRGSMGTLGAPQGSSGLHRSSAGVRGDPQILTGTCRWLQVLRGAPWVLWGLLGAPRVLHIGPQGSRGTPRGSAYKLDTPLTNDLHVYRDQSF